MKKHIQIIVLLIILAVPSSIFIFLHVFGENEYKLDMIDPKAEVQIMNPKSVNCEENVVEGIHRIPPFQFTSQDGEIVTDERLRGKITVVDFFFTRCPNICIDMTSELLRVQEFYKKESNVQILSHSVDPTYDSAQVLKNYAIENGINLNQWTLLTGNPEEIYEMARCGYFIVAKPNEKLENDFVHSDKLILIDKDLQIRGYYSGTDREDVDRLITEIRVLLHEYKES